jgi:hypothetical protein
VDSNDFYAVLSAGVNQSPWAPEEIIYGFFTYPFFQSRPNNLIHISFPLFLLAPDLSAIAETAISSSPTLGRQQAHTRGFEP